MEKSKPTQVGALVCYALMLIAVISFMAGSVLP